MAVNLPPVPHKMPLIDVNGLPSRSWADFFQKAFLRMGGNVASSNDELYTVSTARIENAAVTSAKLASAVAGDGLAGGAGSALSVNVDASTIEISSDALRVKDGGISFVKQLSTDWTSSKIASGYTKLPNGMYLQWGVTGSLASASSTSVNFPTAFPTGCLQAFASVRDNSAVATTATGQWGSGNYSTSAFNIYNRTSVALTFNWFAVGY